MFPLEKLASELILMVMKEVIALDEDVHKQATCRTPPTRNLSALIWASPISLRLYNASPGLVLDRLSSLTQWVLPRGGAYMQAYNAANLRVGLAAWKGPEEEQVEKLVKPHIERMMWFNGRLDSLESEDIDDEFDSLVLPSEYLLFLQSKSHLAEFLDLAAKTRRLGSRLVDSLHDQQPYWTGCTPISQQSASGITREGIHETLLRFQIYCDTFLSDDHVLADEASRHRKAFFTRYDEVSSGAGTGFYDSNLGQERWASGIWNHHHELFYLVLHYIFDEHKTIIRSAAQHLGVTVYPNAAHDRNRTEYGNNGAPSTKESSQVQRLPGTLALENDATRQAQVLRLHNRTAVMEDGYCRYMLSFGLDLVDRLLRMSPDEQCEYTLAEFSWFSMIQEPRACHLKNTAVRGWAPTGFKGTRWEDSKDQSRMAYTAWFWELARRAQVGTNSC